MTDQTNPYIAPTLDADGIAWMEYEIKARINDAKMAALADAAAVSAPSLPTAEDLAQMKRERRMLLVRDHAKNVANGVAASMPESQAALIARAIWMQAEALADTDPLNAFEA